MANPMISINEQQLELYMSLFRGRTEVYARRWEKDGLVDFCKTLLVFLKKITLLIQYDLILPLLNKLLIRAK